LVPVTDSGRVGIQPGLLLPRRESPEGLPTGVGAQNELLLAVEDGDVGRGGVTPGRQRLCDEVDDVGSLEAGMRVFVEIGIREVRHFLCIAMQLDDVCLGHFTNESASACFVHLQYGRHVLERIDVHVQTGSTCQQPTSDTRVKCCQDCPLRTEASAQLRLLW